MAFTRDLCPLLIWGVGLLLILTYLLSRYAIPNAFL